MYKIVLLSFVSTRVGELNAQVISS